MVRASSPVPGINGVLTDVPFQTICPPT
jgi:hypothetical protein